MQNDLSHHRKNYKKGALLQKNVPQNPMNLFQKWFEEAEQLKTIKETNAMTLATIGLDNFPKSRVVLLKKYSQDGFIFYTNYMSEKGKAIAKNPNVSLSFFWQEMERQINIKGIAEKTSTIISDTYFKSRPKGSQLGAVVSNQSEVIPSREILDEKLLKLTAEYEEKEVPRPKNWGGYLVKPISIEFWQGRTNRLHDRILYTLQANLNWKIQRLAP